MSDNTTRSGDGQVPYPPLSHFYAHPDRLATPATLLGLNPPPVERCRVLELGCAGGGNLIPMAYALPESEFVGIDLSPGQIAEGEASVVELGLKNITLKPLNILDVGVDFGEFDYIIAHGVYSWVSPQVQEKLLENCQQNLAANGVAYVSYNTYPGWHMLGAMRDMMCYHAQKWAEPQIQAAEARTLIDFLAGSIPDDYSPHSSFLKNYINFFKERIFPRDDAFLLHDELAEFNEPVYFYQFAERAAQHGLQHLGDAQFQMTLAGDLPPDVAQTLQQMAGDNIAVEQYIDFIYGRTFRHSLLCHEDINLSIRLDADRLNNFYVASTTQPKTARPDIHIQSIEEFCAADGKVLSTDHPLTKAALLYLNEIWPRSMSLPDLLATAQARVNGTHHQNTGTSDIEILGANLLKAYSRSSKLVELHVHAPQFMLDVSPKPTASPVARWQVKTGPKVTNLRHERVTLQGITYHLLPYLDGSRDRTALLNTLQALVEKGIVKIEPNGQTTQQTGQTRLDLADVLEQELQRLARAALLVG